MKQILCCLMLLFTTLAAKACDVCGGSAGSQNLGLLPQFYSHFIGLQYQGRSFSSVHTPLDETKPSSYSDEQYNTVQLWGRYRIGDRVQLFAFLPYQYNSRKENGTTTTMNGLGDVSVLANVALLRPVDTAEWRHMLLAGGGVKAPTGSYAGVTQLDRQGLPNMQPGTGAWDFVVNANYTLRHGNTGINLDAAYTMTTVNSDNYKYGNRLGSSLLGFYVAEAGSFTLMPQAGLRYEYVLHDYENYQRKWLNEQSGGTLAFVTAGMQAYYKRFGMQASYSHPVAQHYGGGNITANHRLDAGLFILF